MFRVIILSTLLLGCVTQSPQPINLPEALPNAIGSAIIYSLGSESEIDQNPYYDDLQSQNLQPFNGHLKIIDHAKISDPQDIQSYLELINGSLGNPEAFSMCFEPRHAIKYSSIYGEVTALICFQCNSVLINIDDWGKQKYFISNPQKQLEVIYDKYLVRKPVNPITK